MDLVAQGTLTDLIARWQVIPGEKRFDGEERTL